LQPFHTVSTITAASAAAQAVTRINRLHDAKDGGKESMGEPELSGFAVVLCRAEEGGNVGSACRAMKNMGLSRLVLAGCPDYDEDRVRMMSVHAFDVYERAERFPDLASALAGFSLSAGFTRRRGERRKAFSLSVEGFAAFALKRPRGDNSAAVGAAPEAIGDGPTGAVALVFGNERTGLTEIELGLCSLAAHIPSSGIFPSLNLAQSVQVACYELRKQALEGRDGGPEPVSRSAAEESVSRIAEHLRGIGFFKVTRDRDLSAFLRDTIERAAYTPSELRYFESIFRKAAGMIRGADREGPR
jgi:TrmH family RNA methyltransferase